MDLSLQIRRIEDDIRLLRRDLEELERKVLRSVPIFDRMNSEIIELKKGKENEESISAE